MPFFKESIDYLGHIISLSGVHADPKKDRGYGSAACSKDSKTVERISVINRLLSSIYCGVHHHCDTINGSIAKGFL